MIDKETYENALKQSKQVFDENEERYIPPELFEEEDGKINR